MNHGKQEQIEQVLQAKLILKSKKDGSSRGCGYGRGRSQGREMPFLKFEKRNQTTNVMEEEDAQ